MCLLGYLEPLPTEHFNKKVLFKARWMVTDLSPVSKTRKARWIVTSIQTASSSKNIKNDEKDGHDRQADGNADDGPLFHAYLQPARGHDIRDIPGNEHPSGNR